MLPTCCGPPRTVASNPLDGEREFMGSVAEGSLTGDDLVKQINRMRAGLDHRPFEPSSFKLSPAAGRKVVRVLFKSESAAAEFAAEFGGRSLSSAASGHVAA